MKKLMIEKVKVFFISGTYRCKKTPLFYTSWNIQLQLMFNDRISAIILLIFTMKTHNTNPYVSTTEIIFEEELYDLIIFT